MQRIHFLFLIINIVSLTTADSISFSDALTAGKELTEGVVQYLNNMLPSPESILNASKQALVGYPFEVLSNVLDTICSSALSSNTISPRITPDINKIEFQLRTKCNISIYPILISDQMWKSPQFDPEKKVVIFVTGWMSNVNESNIIDHMAKAYNCRGDVNFVALDTSNFIDTLYTWSALNTEAIGEFVARGLMQLVDIVPIQKIHLMGHSLGAHIVGATGRHFNYMTGKTLPHITGLDPARPCFNEGETPMGLSRGDAAFIDVIHTNPGVLGIREPLGDADFYPGGMGPLPPGCMDISCAHELSWKLYGETVYRNNEYNFPARRCNSLTSLHQNRCTGADVFMGYAVPHSTKGDYFLDVNTQFPYGKNASAATIPNIKDCGSCQSKISIAHYS